MIDTLALVTQHWTAHKIIFYHYKAVIFSEHLEEPEPKVSESTVTETGDDNIKNDIVTINE